MFEKNLSRNALYRHERLAIKSLIRKISFLKDKPDKF